MKFSMAAPVVCHHCSYPIPRADVLKAVTAQLNAKHKRYSPFLNSVHVEIHHAGRHGCGNAMFVVVKADA